MRVIFVVVAALAVGNCCTLGTRLRIPPFCADGLPPKILTNVACPPDSICGYSCEPGRWTVVKAARL